MRLRQRRLGRRRRFPLRRRLWCMGRGIDRSGRVRCSRQIGNASARMSVPQATRCVLAQTTHHRWSVAARRMAARSPVRPQLATDPEVIPACRSTQRSQALAAHLRRGRQQRCRPLPRSRPRAPISAGAMSCAESGVYRVARAPAASSRAPDPRSACARPPPAPPRRTGSSAWFSNDEPAISFRFQTQQRRRPPASAARALPHAGSTGTGRGGSDLSILCLRRLGAISAALVARCRNGLGRAGPTLLGNPK